MFENKNDYGGHLTWEWYKGEIKKAWRDKHNHVWVQFLFPGEGEESKVDLSDGKKYLTDWVLLSEQKEGGMARQKKAKTKHAAAPSSSSSSSGEKRPCPPSRAPAASKPKAKKRKQ